MLSVALAICGGGQYRQQFRVIEKKQVSYAINASGIPILVIKKWKNELKR